MIAIPYRKTFALLTIALIFTFSVIYDTLVIKERNQAKMLMIAGAAACFMALFLLQKYPRRLIQPVLLTAWPLHLYTICLLVICVGFHHGSKLDQVIVYTLFGYASYVLLPMIFLIDKHLFVASIKLIALMSAVLAIPSFAGAVGLNSFFGLPIRNKTSYATFSGIIASGGIFEHGEGHAFQMAIGIFCSLYAFRKTASKLYLVCLMMTLLGMIISQGRAAIFGVGLASGFMVLPEIFRRSRPLFFATVTLGIILPFVILPALASIPGLSGYMRVQRGLSGRDEAWKYAITAIREKPWKGHGLMASTELTEDAHKILRRSGFSGAGTTFHNTFITKTVDTGLIATFVYSLLYLVPFSRVCRATPYPLEESLVRSLLILTLTTSLFRDYSIGGIRSTALIGTIFLGLGNLWNLTGFWEHDWQADYRPSRVLPHAVDEPEPQLDFGQTT